MKFQADKDIIQLYYEKAGERMKISTKGRYALRLMLGIALRSEGEPVSLRDVAKQEGISDKYLEQIVTPLNRAGLVGDLTPVPCADTPQSCPRAEVCVTQEVWARVAAAVAGVVDNITLADLVQRYQEKQKV